MDKGQGPQTPLLYLCKLFSPNSLKMVMSKESAEIRRRILPNRRTNQQSPLISEVVPDSKEELTSPPFQAASNFADPQVRGKVEDQSRPKSYDPPKQSVNWLFVGLLTIAAYASRFYKISAGSFVL